MNKKQFEIWEKQKRREYRTELEKLQDDLAARGLTFSGARIKAEEDLKERYDGEIEIMRLGVEDGKEGEEDIYINALHWAHKKQHDGFTWKDLQGELNLSDQQMQWLQKLLRSNMPIKDNLVDHYYGNSKNPNLLALTQKGLSEALKYMKSNQINRLSKYWWKDPPIVVPSIVLFLVTIIASDYWAPRIFGNSLPSVTSASTQKTAVELQNTIPSSNLRPLQPLETGKGISLLPNNTYFYSSALSVVYQLENMEVDFMKGENEYLHNYSFEIQKSNSRYYVIGFISDEAYSNVGSVSSANSLFTVLFPESWGGAKNPIAIPFDKVYTAKERTVNLDANQNIKVLDIGFKEVLDNPIVHAK